MSIGSKGRKSGLPVMLNEVEAFLDFFSDEEISSSLQRSNAQRPTLNVQIDLPAEGLEPTRPCGHWILSPARLPIPPRRRGQEHTHFARLDEHFDWPGTQAASRCCTWTQSSIKPQTEAAPVCCFEDSSGDGVGGRLVN